MPDVSVYITLCDMLGISINEFFAGEDIREENYIQKSEDNLIRIAKDSKYKIKKHLSKLRHILKYVFVLIC